MLDVGAPLPVLCARPVAGPVVDTRTRRVVALVFLRHAGSAVTRAAVSDLDAIFDDTDRRGVLLVAVVEGEARAAFDLVPRLKLRFPVIYDGDGLLYDQFGVDRSPLLRPGSPLRYLRALARAGHGLPGGPFDRRCAAYIARAGTIAWAWRARDLADAPHAAELLAQTGA